MKHLRILTVHLEFETRKVICHIGLNTESSKRSNKKQSFSVYHCKDVEIAYEGLEDLLKLHAKAKIMQSFRLYVKLSLLEIIADHLTETVELPSYSLEFTTDTVDKPVRILVGISPILRIKGPN